MSIEEVTAKLGKEEDSPSITVSYDFGSSLEDAVEMFGEEVVFSRFRGAAVVDLQALIRRHAGGEKPKSEEEINTLAGEWKPGVSRKKKSQKEKALDLLADMTPEEVAELVAGLSDDD
jgi:hypothetical protein